jgi:glycosyltransferase involved in cell wall biosynthesis
MRIGIDARELFGRPTGVGRYLAQLLGAWAELPEARRHSFVLYDPLGPVAGVMSSPSHALAIARRPVPGGSGTWWEQARLPLALRRDRLDVLFAPAYTAPLLAGVPVALTIHDLSFVAHPEWFAWRERTRRRWLTTASARAAACVLTDSAFSKSEIVRLLKVTPDRVRVIPLAANPAHLPGADPAAAPGDSRPGDREPLVLYVGSIFSRRRLRDLIKAFATVARSHPELRLEIVGDNRSHPHEDLPEIAAGAGVGDRVTIRAYVPDATLADLYSRAAVFAFLSEYEGFGLTPLEALANGVPPLVLDTAVAREVYGDAALYVPLDDLEATADAMRRLLFDAQARASILGRAPAVLGRYSWQRTARETLAALESVARQPARTTPAATPSSGDPRA